MVKGMLRRAVPPAQQGIWRPHWQRPGPGTHGGPGPARQDFGLWRVCFPPCLVRPGRRLPVQGLSEGSLGFRDRLPA